jgi:hypothetical protein
MEGRRKQQRDYMLRSKYGITLAQYEMLLAAQEGCCAICKTIQPGRYGVFHIDHDHETGVLRKLLCERCNVGLGYFQESMVVLQAAMDYLREFKSETKND